MITASCFSPHEAILGWLVAGDVPLDQVLAKKVLISSEDVIKDIEHIPMKCLDESVSLARVRKYFRANAWKTVADLVERVMEESTWFCVVCNNELDTGESIGCDACLEWYHMKCAGVQNKPKKKVWICRSCYKTKNS